MKDQTVEKLKAQIDKWSAEIDIMEGEINKLGADVRLNYEVTLQELKERRDRAVDRYEQLKGASGDSIEILREGALTAYNDLVKSFKAAKDALQARM